MRMLRPASCILTLTLSVALQAQNSGPQATVAIRSGLVEVHRGDAWQSVNVGEKLNPGQRIRTASGSTAALDFGPNRIVTLNEKSEVQLGYSRSPETPVVQLESGSMKVLSLSDVLITTKDTVLEPEALPLDLEVGYQENKLNVTVFSGAVRNGPTIIRGGNQDPTVRTYSAGGR